MDLDALYGKCMPAARPSSEDERRYAQASRSILDGVTGSALARYLDTTTLRLASTLHQTTPILWLIDEDGNARFALEEVIDKRTKALKFVLPSSQRHDETTESKLGHPSLVAPSDDPRARIGGEIKFSEGEWRLSNKSGRFGMGAHIEREHLDNAAALFANHGVNLKPFWL